MKKNTLFGSWQQVAIIATFLLSGLTSFGQYCLPTYGNQCTSGDFIESVTIGTISNTATGCANPSANNYTDYTAQSTDITADVSIDVTVSAGASWGQSFGLWIDANQDGDFQDADEFYTIGYAAAGTTITTPITVPNTVMPGITRMRVRCQFGTGALTQTDDCSALTWGEAEDYTVNLLVPVVPIITCPMDVSTTASSGICGAVVGFTPALASDPDGGPVTVAQTAGLPSGSEFPVGVSTIEFTATDQDGDTSTCTFNITVTDDEAPTMTCGADVAQDNDAGTCAATVVVDAPTVMDNCAFDITGLVNDYNGTADASGTYPVGTTVVTWTYTDGGGNTAMCTQNVVITDTEAPVVFCIGEPAVFSYSENFEAATIPADWTTEIVSGNFDWTFGSGDMPINGDFPTNAVIFDDDAAGGGELDNTVRLLSPVFDLDGAIVANLSFDYAMQDFAGSGSLSVEVWDGAAWIEILFVTEDTDPTPSGVLDMLAYANSNFQVRYTYDDDDDFAWGAGVDTFLLDYEFMASAPFEVDLDANGNATVNAADLIMGATDNCGTTTVSTGIGMSSDIMVNGSFEDGDFTGWTVVEFVDPFIAYGVVDIFNPGFTFADALATDGTLFAANGFDAAGPDESVLYQEVSIPADAATATLSWDENIDYDLQSFCTGCLDRIYEVQVRDLSDNVLEVLQTVTAEGSTTDIDNVWLSFTADLSAYAGQDVRIAFWQNVPETFTGPAKYSLDNVQLNVDTVVQMATIDFDCSNLGENLVEVTVTDASGNTSTCTATVNVNDVTNPVLVCQDATIELGPDGTAEVDPLALLATMPDTVGEAVVIGSDNQSNAEGFTSFVVDITDAATIEFDWDYTTTDLEGFDGFGYVLNGTYTELTDETLGNQSGSASVAVVPGDVFGYTSQTDDNGFGNNETVITNFMPGYTGQFDPANWTLTLDNSDGDAFFVIIPGGPLSFDACGITVLAVDVTEVTCADIGTPITVTVFASDASGNLASCTSVVTVVDALAPEVVCPADQTVDPGPGNLFYEIPDYYATGDATATDNCTDPLTILSQDPAAGTLVPDGTYTITMSATDEYGNVGTCTFELEVISVLGVSDNVLDSAITMFPNPANTTVTLANTSNVLLDQAAIYDTNGRLVSTIDLSDMQQEKVIDVSTLATGVYMVQVISENASTVKRLVKE